jgi:FkbM family methyltransferase
MAELPDYKISYSQNREDLLLAGVLRKIEAGYYVDVGANHPELDSVTKLFYDKGWSGINIEPNDHLHSELCRQRPRDVNLKAGLSSQEGTLRFRTYPAADGLSTFSSDTKDLYETLRLNPGHLESSVDVLTLAQVLRKHRPHGDIHFLKVDVEGLELEVLLGNAWDRFRPWIVCIERTLFHARREATTAFLSAWSYTPVFFDGINDYLIANERRAVWDEFSYAREMILTGPSLHRLFVDHLKPVQAKAAPEPAITHVRQLLDLDGESFLRAAYATVLKRAPDAGGLAHYQEELSRGVSKIAIVARMRNSEEGRHHRHHLAGYWMALLGDRLRHAPRKSRREAMPS